MLLVRTGHLKKPTLRGRSWYPHCVDAEMETRKVTERAYGFTPKESEPTQVWSKTYAHMDTKEGKGQGREETYFGMIVFLSRRRKLRPLWSPEYSWEPGTAVALNGFSPSGASGGQGQGGASAGRIWEGLSCRDRRGRPARPARLRGPPGSPPPLAGTRTRGSPGSSGEDSSAAPQGGAPVRPRAVLPAGVALAWPCWIFREVSQPLPELPSIPPHALSTVLPHHFSLSRLSSTKTQIQSGRGEGAMFLSWNPTCIIILPLSKYLSNAYYEPSTVSRNLETLENRTDTLAQGAYSYTDSHTIIFKQGDKYEM